MKLIIAGGRDFNDYPKLASAAKYILSGLKRRDIEIVSGMARGADLLGVKFANEHQLHLKEMPANWDKYGKSAGYRRNAEMIEYGDVLLAFWDGKSKGTYHMINLADQAEIRSVLIHY